MQKVSSFFDTRRVSGIIAATILSLLLVAGFTYGVTTISTNISTGGTLTVTGETTLSGNATSSNTFNVAGNLFVNGRASTSGTTGNFATDGTLTVNGAATLGDAVTDNITITGNATSSNSFNVTGTATFSGLASTSQLIVGGFSGTNGVVSGMLFGTCNLTAATLAASTTANFACASASGIRGTETVFVVATSSLTVLRPYANQVYIRAASTSLASQINVDITNGFGETETVAGTLRFWAVR